LYIRIVHKKLVTVKILLFPFAVIYGFIVWFRNRMFDHGFLKSKEFNIPIISVGNITVGGTGKTPHVEYLVKLLYNTHKISVLSRGYKRTEKGIIEATEASTGYQIGDEPKQIKQKFPDASVIVSGNRVKAINKIIAGKIGNTPDVIILDDAFQHRYVQPGLSILLMDFNRPIYDDHIMPYGRLRESASEQSRANIVIITKAPATIKPIERRIIYKNLNLYPYQTLLFSYLKYGELIPLLPELKKITLNICKENDFAVLLLTGIANPAPLKEYLENYCSQIFELQYPDHYRYAPKDLVKITNQFSNIEADNKIIITTEKDAVRLRDVDNIEENMLPIYYIPIEIGFIDDKEHEFDKKVTSYIYTNRKKSGLNHSTL